MGQQVYLAREGLEIQQRTRLMSSMSQDFNSRLPKVELFLRWAERFDEENVVDLERRSLCGEVRELLVSLSDILRKATARLDSFAQIYGKLFEVSSRQWLGA